MKRLLLILFLLASYSLYSSNKYVATTGNDSNPGTEVSPYLTIAKGVSMLTAGDVLIVEDGNYNITGDQIANITQDGNSSNWITIKSRNKYGAKIIGKNTGTLDYEVGFQLTGANYIKIENFEIDDVSFAGIRALDGVNTNIEIRDVKISTVGDICVDTFYGLCGVVFDKVTNGLVERCWIENIGRRAVEEGCTNPDDNYKNHDHGVYINGCTNITVKNSVFNKINHGQGIHIYSSSGLSSTGVNVLNNTFYDGNAYSTQAAGHIILWGNLSNTVIANNIFHTQYNSGIQIYQGSYTYSNVLITKNMTYGGTGTTTDGTATGVTISNNYNSTNPLFTNTSTKDFSLLSSSPAINLGYATGITTDFNSNIRDASIDIGAYEYAAIPIYYVAKTGSDSNPGTEASPFLTITKGLTMIPGGGTVYVKAGTYQEYVWMLNSGTTLNPIILKNYGTDIVTIDAQSTRAFCIYGEDKSNWVIDGINTLNSANYNVCFKGCSNITYKNASITNPVVRVYNGGAAVFGIYVYGSTSNWATNILIENVVSTGGRYAALIDNKTDGVTIKGGLYTYASVDGIGMNWSLGVDSTLYKRHFTIDGAEISYNMRQGIQTSGIKKSEFKNFNTHHNGASGIQIEDWSSDMLIQDFESHDNCSAYTYETGLWVDNADNITIKRANLYNNSTGLRVSYAKNFIIETSLIYDNILGNASGYINSSGIDLSNSWATVYNCTLYNNAHKNSQLASIALKDTGRFVLKNNIISMTNAALDVTDRGTATIIMDYNLYYNTRSLVFYETNGFVSRTYTQWQGLGYDTHSINDNPFFVDLTNNILKLQSISPAINAGVNVGLTNDYIGNGIVGVPDIGAYEYITEVINIGNKKVIINSGKPYVRNGKVILF